MNIKPSFSQAILWGALFALLFGFSCFGSEPEQRDVADADKIARELLGKLGSQGSFQADYRMVALGKSGDTIFLFNEHREFFYARIRQEQEEPEAIHCVMDFSRVDGKRDGFRILVVSDGEGQELDFSFRWLFGEANQLDNPLGILRLFAKQFENATDTKLPDTTPRKPTMRLKLGLTEDHLLGGFGMDMKKLSQTGASWLDPATITNAVAIFEGKDYFRFEYENEHVVLVDKNTGLLLKDSYPDPANPGLREVSLVKCGELQDDRHFSELIPGFDKIDFKKASLEQLKRQMMIGCLTELGRSLGKVDGYEEFLERSSTNIAAMARQEGASLARKRMGKRMSKEFYENILQGILSHYEKYKAALPAGTKAVSFDAYMDLIVTKIDMNGRADATFSSAIEQVSMIMKRKCEHSISQLPVDARVPLQQIYEVAVPAYSDGFMEGGMSAMMEKVRALSAESSELHQMISENEIERNNGDNNEH